MNNAQRVVWRLIEAVEDDFDVKDTLLKSGVPADLSGVYADQWELINTASRNAPEGSPVNGTVLTYRNRRAGFFVTVYSAYGDEEFTVHLHSPDGTVVNTRLVDAPGAAGPDDALARAFPAAMAMVKEFSLALWRTATAGA